MRTIYILLSRSNTVCARFIRLMTACRYNHSSISLSPEIDCFYSFGRRRLHNPLIGGFVRETLDAGVFSLNLDQPCVLYALEVSEEAYAKMEGQVSECLANYPSYRYNFLGIPFTYFGIPMPLKKHYQCGQFVAWMLEMTGACTLPRPVSLMQPMDFVKIPELVPVYTGTLGGLADFTPAESTCAPAHA